MVSFDMATLSGVEILNKYSEKKRRIHSEVIPLFRWRQCNVLIMTKHKQCLCWAYYKKWHQTKVEMATWKLTTSLMTHDKLSVIPSVEGRIYPGLVHLLSPVAINHFHIGLLEGVTQVVLLEVKGRAVVDLSAIAVVTCYIIP